MATFLRKARRRALAQRWQLTRRAGFVPEAGLPRQDGVEIDPTPTPRPVTVDLEPRSTPAPAWVAPSLGRFAHAPRIRRIAVAIAAMALFVVGVLAITGAPRAEAEA